MRESFLLQLEGSTNTTQKLQKSPRKKYCCHQSGQELLGKRNLRLHIIAKHMAKNWEHKCDVCPKAFRYIGVLRQHKSTHNGRKEYEWNLCSRKYALKSSLRNHQKSCDKMVSFPCKKCDHISATANGLKCHIKAKHGLKHRCDKCKKIFEWKSSFNRHVKNLQHAKFFLR